MTVTNSARPPVGEAENLPPGQAVAEQELPSFEAVYKQYFDFVWSSAQRFGVIPAAMDDVVQEIFMIVHAKLPTLRQPSSLRSWIYGIVRRTVSDHRRSQRTRAASAGPLAIHAELAQPRPRTPLDVKEQNEQVALLWSVLDELDPAKREIFMLAELEELTVPEIAEIVGIPLNTAYSRLRAARVAFEESLARKTPREGGT